MNYELVIVGALETNCYLIHCAETMECAIVDPGAEAEKIFRSIIKKKFKPVILINTHGHVDHVGANKDIKDKYDIPLCIHPEDKHLLEVVNQSELCYFLGAKESPPPDQLLEEGQNIKIGQTNLKVIHTPGHTPGSISLLGDGFLFSGDTLFFGGVGRTDLPGGSWTQLEDTIKAKILSLDGDIIVLPGHGPSTSVRQEKESNPFVR